MVSHRHAVHKIAQSFAHKHCFSLEAVQKLRRMTRTLPAVCARSNRITSGRPHHRPRECPSLHRTSRRRDTSTGSRRATGRGRPARESENTNPCKEWPKAPQPQRQAPQVWCTSSQESTVMRPQQRKQGREELPSGNYKAGLADARRRKPAGATRAPAAACAALGWSQAGRWQPGLLWAVSCQAALFAVGSQL